jgi:alkanesulfonate monooxygenase SsuD/methylene tetrahydromethanopterin reductase-like flavin-dependent oxidoreductase (luciferase family)
MADEQLPVRFGVNIHPGVGGEADAFARARIADEHGIDLITVMDHPYNADLHETWTLLTALAMRTERTHLAANVLNTPLRPPAMLAKAAATLDRLSGGRFEMAVGAGGFGEAIVGFGGPDGTPGERYAAFKESLEIMRGLWESGGEPFTYEGRFHRVRGAKFGPLPERRIPIWTGALGPRMVRLTGQLADGLLISAAYVQPEQLPEFGRLLDEGAAAAGRPATAVRRGYNLMGVLDLGTPDTRARPRRPGAIVGGPEVWIDTIERLARDYRQDTFTFWPVAGDELRQIEAFAKEVAPDLRARLNTGNGN